MSDMTDAQRNVSIVGGPHDGLTAAVPREATSAVLYCWDNKPVIMKPADDVRRTVAVYTQRGDEKHQLVYRSDMAAEVVE